jgi:hypothetical protein
MVNNKLVLQQHPDLSLLPQLLAVLATIHCMIMLSKRSEKRKDNTRYVDDFELSLMFTLDKDGNIQNEQSLSTFLVLCSRAKNVSSLY